MEKVKKILLPLLIVVCLVIVIIGCISTNKKETAEDTDKSNINTVVPDIKIEDIDWTVGSGLIKGENYVLLEFVNNSQYIIKSFKLKFTEKSSVSEQDKENFYLDIQQSQGFDDNYMTKFKESKKTLNEPITMYGKSPDSVNPSETSSKIKCYYYGGWSSKNVLHSDLLIPSIAEIEYTKENIDYIIYYNFETKLYDVEAKD